MTVKDLISKLLEMPMTAEVFLSDPTPFEDGHGRCNGYYFGIDDVKQNSDVVEIEFTDWRSQKESEEVCQEKKQ
jgi:hypothetical protein